MTAVLLCAIGSTPAALIVGLVRCRRALNQPTSTNQGEHHE